MKRERHPYPKVLPNYRNPRNRNGTAGRGKQPRWLSSQLQTGRKRSDFLIREALGPVSILTHRRQPSRPTVALVAGSSRGGQNAFHSSSAIMRAARSAAPRSTGSNRAGAPSASTIFFAISSGLEFKK